VILGSPGLVQSFAKLVLIDEFVVTVNPVILGGGIPMFKGIDLRIGLHLEGCRQFKSGVIGAHYIRRELISA
jgi:dihydrofolate reductase